MKPFEQNSASILPRAAQFTLGIVLLGLSGCGVGLCVSASVCSSTGPAPRLAFTGNSDSTALLMDRFFDELDSAWVLTGECDVELGEVTVGGTGIDASMTTPCLDAGGGTFEISIGYSAGTPRFEFLRYQYGRKQVTISQTGVPEIETYLYRSRSTHTVSTIDSAAQLQAMTMADNNAFYVLTDDIDFAVEVGPTNNITTLGDFWGVFEGNGHTLSNIHQAPGAAVPAGLFGDICLGCSGAEITSIQNLHVTNLSLTATAAPAGFIIRATPTVASIGLAEIHLAGSVSGGAVMTGGVVGEMSIARVTDVSFTGNVTGTNQVGGIAGLAAGSNIFTGVRFSGAVMGTSQVGGIVGRGGGNFSYNSVEGTVSGSSTIVGGLIGRNTGGNVQYCRANAIVSGTSRVGGLVGDSDSDIVDSYFLGTVVGTTNVGGISGLNTGEGIYRCYTTSDVTGTGVNVGALTGDNSGTFSNYYNLATSLCSGCNNAFTTAALSSVQMKQQASFAGFDFSAVWTIAEGVSAPTLRWEHD